MCKEVTNGAKNRIARKSEKIASEGYKGTYRNVYGGNERALVLGVCG
jgi:hypothetical protein